MSQIGKPPCDDAFIRHGGSAEALTPSARRWVLAATIVGSSMAFIDGTIVNVALPSIQNDLQATASEMQWVVESYALFLASLLLVGGSLGDHFGRRRIFMLGVALFAAASGGCALSGNVNMLILVRGGQCIGGGLVGAGDRAVINASFPVRAPMVTLSLSRNRNFLGRNLLTLWLYAELGGALFFFPLNLIQVQAYSATAAGAALLPLIIIMFFLSRWSGRLVDRVGAKLPLVTGPVIATCGFALFAWPGSGGSYWLTFFPAGVGLGVGMAGTVAPLTTTVMNSIGADLAGIASGVNNAVSRTAALLAIAVFGMVMASLFESNLNGKLEAMDVSREVVLFLEGQRNKLAGAALPSNLDGTSTAMLKRAVGESFVAGFRWIMLLNAGLALMSALGAWMLIDGKLPATRAKR